MNLVLRTWPKCVQGGRGSKKPESMRTLVLIGCVKSVQEGGRGSKKPENLRTYLMDGPLAYAHAMLYILHLKVSCVWVGIFYKGIEGATSMVKQF